LRRNSLCHFAGEVGARTGVVPGDVLSQHCLQEELSDAIDLVEGYPVGQVDGQCDEQEHGHRSHQTANAKGSRIINDRLVVLLFAGICPERKFDVIT